MFYHFQKWEWPLAVSTGSMHRGVFPCEPRVWTILSGAGRCPTSVWLPLGQRGELISPSPAEDHRG